MTHGRRIQLTINEDRQMKNPGTRRGRYSSANIWREPTYEHLTRRVWGLGGDADVRPTRTAISSIRHRLGDHAENPAYIFTEFRVGSRMPGGDVRTGRYQNPRRCLN